MLFHKQSVDIFNIGIKDVQNEKVSTKAFRLLQKLEFLGNPYVLCEKQTTLYLL